MVFKYITLERYHPDRGTIITDSVWSGYKSTTDPDLDYLKNTDDIGKAYTYLLKLGYSKITTKSLVMGGNL